MPLRTTATDWVKNGDRWTLTQVHDGRSVTARVLAVDGDGVTLAVEAKGKPGAKKRPPTRRQVPWQQLGAGRVQVEFGRGRAGEDLAAGETTEAEQADPADDDDGGGQ